MDSRRKYANISLNEVHRRERKRLIEVENLKMAQKLFKIKSSLPARKSLEQEYRHHLKTKVLRCRLPIVNMKKNAWNDGSNQDASTAIENAINRNGSDLT